MKKIVAMGLMMTILLTGCGVPDRVAEEAKKIQKGYISDHQQVKQLNQLIRNKEKQGISFGQDCIVSAKQSEKIKQLYETLEQLKREGLFTYKYIEFNDIIKKESDFTAAERRARLEEYIYGKRSWKNWASSYFTYNVSVKTVEDFMALAKALEKVGFTGFEDAVPSAQTGYSMIASNGVRFEILTFYRDEYNEKIDSIDVTVRVEKKDFFFLPQFAELQERNMEDGFILTGIDYEGYLQRLVYTGSFAVKDNPYQKSVKIYMKNNEFLQMEIDVIGTQQKKGELIFRDEEKATIKNFLTWASGSADEAEKFVTTVTADGDKKGTIGNCEWYRISQNGNLGTQKRIQFRVVAKEE